MALRHQMSVQDTSLEDLEELLQQLTADELEELATDQYDPDSTLFPPSQRCRDQTQKAPTGTFSRKKLVTFLEEKAKAEKDWDEIVPFKKATRGKIFQEKIQSNLPKLPIEEEGDEKVELDMPDDWEQALNEADESDWVDIAGILGFYSMLNQVQFWNAQRLVKLGDNATFRSAAKPESFKALPEEPPNDTDIAKSIEKLRNRDADLVILNLNNIQDIELNKWMELCEVLKDNEHLKSLLMANCQVGDIVANQLIEVLKTNTALRILNVESNLISAEKVYGMVEAMLEQKTLKEFRAANQRTSRLGVKYEQLIVDDLEKNPTLLKVSLFFDTAGARLRAAEVLKRNNDRVRLARIQAAGYRAPEFKPVTQTRAQWMEKKEAPKKRPQPKIGKVTVPARLGFAEEELSPNLLHNEPHKFKSASQDREYDAEPEEESEYEVDDED